MKIFIDSNYICHTEMADGRRELEVEFFDNKTAPFIEGYRYVPQGETWVDERGNAYKGVLIAPATDFNQIMVNVAISYLDDTQAETVTALFPDWETSKAYAVGDRVKNDGLLYRCVQAHTSQSDWTPDKTPALWVRTSTEEWPEWIQPTGAHDAYNTGDKVSHNEKHWISDIDANVYEPGVYGWTEQ